MTKQEFNHIFDDGIGRGKSFVAVKIETEGNPGAEVILNPSENFAAKRVYYNKAYNDDMELISALKVGKRIRIVDVHLTNNLSDLNWFMF